MATRKTVAGSISKHLDGCVCTLCAPGAKVYELMSHDSYTAVAQWATSLTPSEAATFGRLLAR